MIGVICLFALSTGYARTTTGNFQTNSSLTGTCFFSATNASFGEWQPNLAPTTLSGVSQKTTSNVNVLCSNKITYTIKGQILKKKGANTGQFMSASGTDDQLEYNIWLNSAYTQWFADGATYTYGSGASAGSSGTSYISATGTGSIVSHTLYIGLYNKDVVGYIVTPGNYSDAYTLTLNF